jgi:hypothetical protein
MPNALGSNTLDDSTRTTAPAFPSTPEALTSVSFHNLVMKLALMPARVQASRPEVKGASSALRLNC